ncbi:MAG TPA: efflux RND transporter periplasmic adaptor subunit [Candidatus Saccharimonadales bacterium]|nr:efflux RND transporter periplasmic adaptor subunit [Candidatus Saccharimonadales bacterium]
MEIDIPAPRRRRRRRTWVWVLLVAVVVVIGALGLGFYRNGKAGQDKLTADDLDVRTGEATVGDVQVAVSEVGTIEPVVKVDVKSTLSGKVTDLLVREGDRVRSGQVLARVEPDVNQAQTLSQVLSGMKLATIEADDAKKDVEMNQRLYDEGYLSDQQMKTLRVRYDTAKEALDAAKTKMRIVEESGIPLESEISTSQRVNILSPMDGYVILKGVEVGQTVTSGVSSFNEGTVLYTVADLSSMQIDASINEVDIGKIRLGMPVVITIDAFPYREFEGTVSHIAPAARLEDKVKVFDIEVKLDHQVEDFRAGMTANIEIKGDKVEQVLSVPVESIFRKDNREVVYVLKDPFDPPKDGAKKATRTKDGKLDVSESWERFFAEKEIRVGLVSLERAQVIEGLEKGDKIALEDPTRSREIEED